MFCFLKLTYVVFFCLVFKDQCTIALSSSSLFDVLFDCTLVYNSTTISICQMFFNIFLRYFLFIYRGFILGSLYDCGFYSAQGILKHFVNKNATIFFTFFYIFISCFGAFFFLIYNIGKKPLYKYQ